MRAKLVLLFGFLLILFIPSQLGLHFWPDWSKPTGIRIDYLSPTLLFTDILSLLFVIYSLPRSKNFKYLFIFSIFNLISSKYFLISLTHWLRLYLYYFVYVSFRQHFSYQKFWLKALSVSVLWTSALTIAQVANGQNMGGLWYWLGERPLSLAMPYISKIYISNYGYLLRPYATFPHPNALAGFLLVSLIILLQNKKHLITHSLNALITILGAFAILLTFSKTVFFPIAIFVPRSDLLTSVNERLSLYHTAYRLFAQYPFTGVGLGNYPALSFNYPSSSLQLSYQPVHNVWLLLLVELGFPLFIILSYYAFTAIRYLMSNGQRLLIVALLLTTMMDHYWLTSPSNLLLLSLTATLLKSYRVSSKNYN